MHYEDILAYSAKERIGVVSVLMPDGTPHGATVHVAHIDKPLTYIFLASPQTRKMEPLTVENETPATLVIGFLEGLQTLQLDGTAQLEDNEEIRRVYFEKFPEKDGKHPDDVFFTFTPTWWRFTDWAAPEGKTIMTSDGKVWLA